MLNADATEGLNKGDFHSALGVELYTSCLTGISRLLDDRAEQQTMFIILCVKDGLTYLTSAFARRISLEFDVHL